MNFLKLASLLLCISITGIKCRPDDVVVKTNRLKGKLVIDAACAHYVIQVLEGDTSNIQLAATWNNPANNNSYTNVFTVSNVCSFPSGEINQGDIFFFEITKTPAPSNCEVCQIFYPTPVESNAVIDITKLP